VEAEILLPQHFQVGLYCNEYEGGEALGHPVIRYAAVIHPTCWARIANHRRAINFPVLARGCEACENNISFFDTGLLRFGGWNTAGSPRPGRVILG
jgi:hypothetical protein